MNLRTSRRTLLGGAFIVGVAAACSKFEASPEGSADASAGDVANPWARADAIQDQVRAPKFADRVFNIVDHGAVADGQTNCTEAFAAAIDACNQAGGGQVLVPAGRYFTGPIHLKSNVNLYLADDATILFSTEPSDYLPAVLTRFEGMELWNYSPLIYAYECTNVAVTGAGTLDGQAGETNWWPWKGKEEYGWVSGDPEQSVARDRLIDQVANGVPVEDRVYGNGDFLRSSFIQPYKCTNVWVQGVTILRSPMWEVHPVLCENVLVEGVTIDTHGPNNDGCNPECCSQVVIQDSTFATGDDCIAIKSGRNDDGRRVGVPSTDLLVQRCKMADGHGGVTIGSEMSGGVSNVYVRDCQMSSPNLDIALRFKTNAVRGGYITDFWAKDVTIGTVAKAVIDVDFEYEEGRDGDHLPEVSGINVSNMTVETAGQSMNIRGYSDDFITGLYLTDVNFGTTAKPPTVEYVNDIVFINVYENGVPLEIS